MEAKENKMGVMPVPKLLLNMSLPMVISMFIQAMYNLIDSIYVAHIPENSQDALTAVNMAFPMQSLMIAFQTGLGVGMNALVSRLLGEKKPKEAGNAALHGMFLTLCNYLLFLIVGLTLTGFFYEVQSNSPLVIEYGREYLTIVCTMSFGLYFQICFERFLQSTGNTLYSMIMQGVGALINIGLDPLFIFGFNMGVKGAAIATVAGQCISCALGAILHFTKNRELRLSFRDFRLSGAVIGKIYSVGIPSILMSALVSVMTYGINIILKGYEEVAATAFGVYFKLQSFVVMSVFGMNNGIVPIIAYNYGAKNGRRIVKTVKLGICAAVGAMLVGFALFQMFPSFFLGFFNPDDDLVRVGIPTLRILSISFITAGASIIMTSTFQATGHGFMSLCVFLVRLIFPTIPLAWLLGKLGGVTVLWFALPISDLLGLALAALLMRKIYKQVIKPLTLEKEPESSGAAL